MQSSTERFSNRVENYVKFRPSYPSEVLQVFRDEMNLQTASIIADIGSGTGISAKIFLENGNEVFGIEPNQPMREASGVFLQNFLKFHSINGTAENTTLEDNSVDIIIAAQAFHWFDKAKTRIEFRRILRDNGFTALIWNERQLNSNEFLREYESFLIKFGSDYKQVRHENVSEDKIADFFEKPFRKKTFLNSQTLDFSGLKGRVLSSSYMPSAEDTRFGEMEKELKQLFTRFQKNDTIEILYDTNIYFGQL
ncbi:MAG: class I SAM-dependent methyltransferase [Pyrinomonadaceae bacterium]|nr:class I SAM-dependent methyltransferase [Pyrinomonadaceae bacterium]